MDQEDSQMINILVSYHPWLLAQDLSKLLVTYENVKGQDAKEIHCYSNG